MVENILKAYLKIREYSRNNNKSYDDAFYQLEYKYFDFGRLSCQNSRGLFYFRSKVSLCQRNTVDT